MRTNRMTPSKRFLSGALPGYTYQAMLMLVGLWLTPFLSGRIGQHEYGIWLIGLQALGYLVLADIGVVEALAGDDTLYLNKPAQLRAWRYNVSN